VEQRHQQQIGGVLALIRDLTGPAMRAESVAELLTQSLTALHRCVDFDLGAAVMLEQNLDLHVVTRDGAMALIGEPLVAKIRQAIATLIPISFEATDVVVRSQEVALPSRDGDDDRLEHEAHAMIALESRTAGVVLLYRGDDPFDDDECEVLEIFAAQVSMLLVQKAAREQIMSLADTDDLTGIWNKRYFRRQLPQEMERSRVYSLPMSLLMFDVDDFKEINDRFGHTIGDVVLSELCGAVRESLRPPDLFARFGGDEFAVILPHTDLAGACAVADRILEKVRMLTIPAEEEAQIQCSISIGVADFEVGADTAVELIRRADERLYESKRSGKNRYTA
jgi:diguanylate cyclase (GGDEF)-like protein